MAGRRKVAAVAAGLASAASLAGVALAARIPSQPIPEEPSADAPLFIGSPASANPVRRFTDSPRHPFMAPNGDSNIHVDAYQTDANRRAGPLGRRMRRVSTYQNADCASVTFDRFGRIVTVCVGAEGPRLMLLDPDNLDELARFPLPAREQEPGGDPFTDFAGGGYFYLDHRDRAVVPTTDRHVYVVRIRRTPVTGDPMFERVRDYNLNGVLDPDDAIVSALPDWSGRVWFVSAKGVVGRIAPRTERIRARTLAGEGITNSFSVDERGAVYVVSDRALYRFQTGPRGGIRIVWRREYENTFQKKPGQVDDGSGTTPTVMAGRYVAITDNDDPMNVVVYRRARNVSGGRKVCQEPVFRRGRSATDNSLIASRRSLVVENNYGYTGPTSTMDGGVTARGIERVRLDRDGQGCHTVWHSGVRSPTVVPKLSLGTGLVYAYTKNRDSDDPWYLTALDFRTGETVFKRRAGFGLGFNNNYAPITLGPKRTAYVGTLGGLVALRDRPPR
jgi:hypothetical protein